MWSLIETICLTHLLTPGDYNRLLCLPYRRSCLFFISTCEQLGLAYQSWILWVLDQSLQPVCIAWVQTSVMKCVQEVTKYIWQNETWSPDSVRLCLKKIKMADKGGNRFYLFSWIKFWNCRLTAGPLYTKNWVHFNSVFEHNKIFLLVKRHYILNPHKTTETIQFSLKAVKSTYIELETRKFTEP